MKRKAKRSSSNAQSLDRLVRAANAVIRSARQNVRSDRPWPKTYYAPCSPLNRMAEVINQLGKAGR